MITENIKRRREQYIRVDYISKIALYPKHGSQHLFLIIELPFAFVRKNASASVLHLSRKRCSTVLEIRLCFPKLRFPVIFVIPFDLHSCSDLVISSRKISPFMTRLPFPPPLARRVCNCITS